MPRRAALIDLDGTLIDSTADLAAAVNALLAERGLSALPEATVRGLIGRGARNLVTRSLEAAGGAVPEVPEAWVRRWMDLYAGMCLRSTRCHPGAEEALDRLRSEGWRLAVITNKPTSLSVQILDGLGVSARLDLVLGGDSLPDRKPSAAPLTHALRELGVRAEHAVMVGDSEVDVVAGRAAGVRTLGCTWGIGDRDALVAAGPDRLAGSWAEAVGLLLGGDGPA